MPEIRETHVERDEAGRVTDTKVTIERPKRRGGFSLGIVFGLILAALGVGLFAYSQGSFQSAGVEADQAAAQAERQIETTLDQSGQAVRQAENDFTVSEAQSN